MLIKKELSFFSISVLIVVCLLGSSGSAIADLNSVYQENSGIPVVASIDSYIDISILKSPLKFHIERPDEGTFREKDGEHARVAIDFNCPVSVTFEASELKYTSDQDINLNATYWVNHPGNSNYRFRPDEDYTISRLDYDQGEDVTKYFNIYGKIELESVSAQPAGEYNGVITVTVSKLD